MPGLISVYTLQKKHTAIYDGIFMQIHTQDRWEDNHNFSAMDLVGRRGTTGRQTLQEVLMISGTLYSQNIEGGELIPEFSDRSWLATM